MEDNNPDMLRVSRLAHCWAPPSPPLQSTTSLPSPFPFQVLLRAPPAPPGPDHVLFDQFWVGTGGGPLPGPGQGGRLRRRRRHQQQQQQQGSWQACKRWLHRSCCTCSSHAPQLTIPWPPPAPRVRPADGSGGAFVLTPTVQGHLRNLARAVLLRRYPILLQARDAGAGRLPLRFLA